MTEQDRNLNAPLGGDPADLVQAVLRDSYLQATEDLRLFAEKVGEFNRRKKAVRAYLAALGGFRGRVMAAAREREVDLCRQDKEDLAILDELFREHAHAYDVAEVEYELCIPDRVPRAGIDSFTGLDNEIARWTEVLNGVGDDAQLANVDLQNMLQTQQQTLQMLSNISKLFHDSAMAVIRKMSG